ncbi:DNA-3-methyladenine glycosylase family protein [Frigoribacterium sp. 2-23]|uniref:DNA-3-methyladenine glycosylase family protein n=1 Tax=Frigoribacterium sp. 2-23 TaxID=3415006 RepID=UPI003C703434
MIAPIPTRLRLTVDGPYDAAHAVGLLAAHTVPGAERTDVESGTHARLLSVGGAPARVDLRFTPEVVDVEVRTGAPDGLTAADAAELSATIRRWLDLDADLDRVAAAFADDALLAPLVAARPGIRITGHPVGFEAATMTVLGQQVSLAAARTFVGRLVAHYPGGDEVHGLTPFPTPQQIVDADHDELRAAVGVTNSRARTLRAVATAFVDGLELAPDVDHDDARRRLLAVSGIGPWTVEYVAVRALADRDAFPAGDLVLRRVLGGISTAAAETASLPWSPLRAYALFHLWADAIGPPQPAPPAVSSPTP